MLSDSLGSGMQSSYCRGLLGARQTSLAGGSSRLHQICSSDLGDHAAFSVSVCSYHSRSHDRQIPCLRSKFILLRQAASFLSPTQTCRVLPHLLQAIVLVNVAPTPSLIASIPLNPRLRDRDPSRCSGQSKLFDRIHSDFIGSLRGCGCDVLRFVNRSLEVADAFAERAANVAEPAWPKND